MVVANRICHVPTDVSSSNVDGSVSDRDIHHHSMIAKGGTGLIIVGATSPNLKTGRSTVTGLSIDTDSHIPGFARLAESMQKYGAKCAVQLQYPGRQAAMPREGKLTATDQAIKLPWSQSRTIVYANHDEAKKTMQVLSTDDVVALIDEFSEAAWRVKQAGFDAVELHAAHGYLISQFMSPYLNRRSDRFGGSLENRMRFPLGIIASIQGKCGYDFPVIVRYSSDEWVPGGRELPESILVAKMFEEVGVAALDISQCIQESPGAGFDPMYYEEGWTVYATEAIKQEVSIPVINSHTLRDPEYCEQILAEEKTDMIGLARQILADPFWPIKAQYDKVDSIRKCISCLTGCWQESMMAKKEIACAINPACGNIAFSEMKKSSSPKKVAIIGGGPAGMEAARVAAERGHKPVIFEKSAELGGAILGCCMTPGKDVKMKWYADWIRRQVSDLGIPVHLNTVPAVNELSDFDLVINATGASSYVPETSGNVSSVIPFEDVMACPKISCEYHPQNGRTPRKLTGKKVIVWGDHYAAADTAARLAANGKEVTIVTDRNEFGSSIEVIHLYVLLKRFKQEDAEALSSKPFKYPVTIVPKTRIVEIKAGEVVVLDKDLTRSTIACDHVVTCWTQPNIEMVAPLREAGLTVINVGDSVQPRNLHAAVREGATAGLQLDEFRFVNPNNMIVDEIPIDVQSQLSR